MHNQFLDIPWTIWGTLCIVIGIIYTILWPRAGKKVKRTSLQYFVIRWFHGIVWFLLGISCFLRTDKNDIGISNGLALLALLMYLFFIGTLIRERLSHKKMQS